VLASGKAEGCAEMQSATAAAAAAAVVLVELEVACFVAILQPPRAPC
jgi:hypothetical protein